MGISEKETAFVRRPADAKGYLEAVHFTLRPKVFFW